jgi:hypothetical protein
MLFILGTKDFSLTSWIWVNLPHSADGLTTEEIGEDDDQVTGANEAVSSKNPISISVHASLFPPRLEKFFVEQ